MQTSPYTPTRTRSTVVAAIAVAVTLSLSTWSGAQPTPRAFATPEEAVEALRTAAAARGDEAMLALLGPDGRELAASADAATTRQHRAVFLVAMREAWRLVDVTASRKELIVGNEAWPFPVPLTKTAGGWAFDTAAGKEEVLTRRIGRNELAAIRIAGTYVTAQRAYAAHGHDGKPAGLYARRFASTPGTEDGLYWPVKAGASSNSPFGELAAKAAAEGRDIGDGTRPPVPFHGYYFRVLERQGAAAKGGARNYVVNGAMSGGFALIAWPAKYDVTGIMTFIVAGDGIVYEKDLGPKTSAAANGVAAFNPDKTWTRVVAAAEP